MSRNDDIEGLAEFVADEYWQGGQVDPCHVASRSGLTFSFGHYEDCFDGLLECRAHRFHVYLNIDRHGSAYCARMRFSFAHELGHFFLDWHRHALEHGIPAHGSSADFQSSLAIEHEADLFAANLLLPRDKLKAAAHRHIDAAEIQRLAALFGTSLSATAIRCALLDLSSLIVMGWTAQGRRWCWSSARYRPFGNKAFKNISALARDSNTWHALKSPYSTQIAASAKGTTLSAWFPAISAGSLHDEVLLEECICLGRYGALTILRPC